MLFSRNSQLLLRNQKIFKTKKIFFLGHIQDSFPAYLKTAKTSIYFEKYNYYLNFKKIKNIKNINIYNNLLISKEMITNCDTIIYYWPKDKSEANFQLINILSFLPIKTTIFIVGENSSGIKSAFVILHQWIKFKKIDNAKHCILISGYLERKKNFILEDFFKIHFYKNFYIKSLPGVFGYKKIDEGSKLLASTFSKNIRGKVLDIGCGTGFLSAYILYYSKDVNLTVTDNSTNALLSTQATLNFNQFTAKVILSDLYSNIFQKFDLIISNPPFHENLKINFDITKKIISDSVKYLNLKGELRFVVNSCFSYDILLKKIFKKYIILKKTKKYKVYQAFLN